MPSPLSNIDLVEKIKDALKERFSIDVTQVDENSRLRDMGLDSLHVLDIMLDMESEFGVKLEDLAVAPNPSLGDIAIAIAQNMAASA